VTGEEEEEEVNEAGARMRGREMAGMIGAVGTTSMGLKASGQLGEGGVKSLMMRRMTQGEHHPRGLLLARGWHPSSRWASCETCYRKI
jgi:hypothetical protein